MTIYVTGDIHGDIASREFLLRKYLTKDDILLVLGDFGYSWNEDAIKEWNSKKFKFTTISLFGNHENFSIIKELPRVKKYDSNLISLNKNTFYVENGEMLNIKGIKFFCFGGALSIDKELRIPFVSWWPEEIPSNEEYDHALITLASNDFKFDYLLTHTCDRNLKNEIFRYPYEFNDPTEIMIERFKELISNKGSYNKHYFGHHHSYEVKDNVIGLYTEVVELNDCIPLK